MLGLNVALLLQTVRTLCGIISSFFSSVFGLKPTLYSMLFTKTPFSSTEPKKPPFWIFCDFISPTALSKAWTPHSGVTTNHHQSHNLTGFFFSLSKFLMGGSTFLVPISPKWGRSRMGEGICEKNLTEAKTAHLMHN